MVKMTLSGETISISQNAVQVVSKAEYSKFSKYLSKYGVYGYVFTIFKYNCTLYICIVYFKYLQYIFELSYNERKLIS